MKMRVCALLIFLSLPASLTMERPLKSKSAIITKRLNTAQTATKKLQALINDSKRLKDPRSLDQIKRLILQGANPNIANSDGLPLLQLVIKELYVKGVSRVKQREIIQILLKAGASLAGHEVSSPLGHAIYYNLPEVVELLLEYGALLTDYHRTNSQDSLRTEILKIINSYSGPKNKIP